MTCKPFPQSFWVYEGLLCAGCYPGDLDSAKRDAKLRGLLDCNIRLVVSLMEATEKSHGGRSFSPYVTALARVGCRAGHARRVPMPADPGRLRPHAAGDA